MSKPYRIWLATALVLLRAERPEPVKGSYRMAVVATPPDRRRRDLSNILKAIEDVLVKAGVVEDDSLARRIELDWSHSPPAKPGSVTVTLEAA